MTDVLPAPIEDDADIDDFVDWAREYLNEVRPSINYYNVFPEDVTAISTDRVTVTVNTDVPDDTFIWVTDPQPVMKSWPTSVNWSQYSMTAWSTPIQGTEKLMSNPDPDPDLTEVDVLERAAEVMRSRGLAQNMFADYQGHICTMSAIYLGADPDLAVSPAIGISQWFPDTLVTHPARLAAEGRVTRAIHRESDYGNICGWNNVRDRSAEDVVELLTRAAEEARSEA